MKVSAEGYGLAQSLSQRCISFGDFRGWDNGPRAIH